MRCQTYGFLHRAFYRMRKKTEYMRKNCSVYVDVTLLVISLFCHSNKDKWVTLYNNDHK